MGMADNPADFACLLGPTATALLCKRTNDLLDLAGVNVEHDALSIVRGNEQPSIARTDIRSKEFASLHVVPRERSQHRPRIRHQIRPVGPRDHDHRIRRGVQMHHGVHALRSDNGVLVVHDRIDGGGHGRVDLSYRLGRPSVPDADAAISARSHHRQKTIIAIVIASPLAGDPDEGMGEDYVAAAIHVRFVPSILLQHSGCQQSEFAASRVVASGQYFGAIGGELDTGYRGPLVAHAAYAAVGPFHPP
mmetsp:Transcript_6213/g.15460  ORF Transcript_6213/g.15460 Transcript_6213/m.15460 type:complete len:248 (+) Transcript_6213:177-920(+)